ncbi:MAG: hypothetical protein JO156_12115, partial [Solirubrobacterales bacterium]|nr:hypothetical protein [Solirubrobacterales bacterium]
LNRRVTIAFQAKAPAPPAAPPESTSAPVAAATSPTITYGAVQGDGSIHNYTVRPELAYRDGNLLVVRAIVTCMGAGNPPAAASTTTNPDCDGNDFAGSETVPPETPHQFNLLSWVNSYTMRTLYLADPASGSEYIPAALPDDQPVTAALPQLSWSNGQSYAVWAYFSAPPATSTKVTVLLAGGGSTQIPIDQSPPALASSGG